MERYIYIYFCIYVYISLYLCMNVHTYLSLCRYIQNSNLNPKPQTGGCRHCFAGGLSGSRSTASSRQVMSPLFRSRLLVLSPGCEACTTLLFLCRPCRVFVYSACLLSSDLGHNKTATTGFRSWLWQFSKYSGVPFSFSFHRKC